MKTVALALIALCLVPVSIIHGLISRVRSRGKVGGSRQIPHVRASDVRLSDVMARRQPVVIEGLAGAVGLDRPFDLELLHDMASEVDEPFAVDFFSSHSPFFLYTGDYGLELDHTSEMTLADFLDTLFAGDLPSDLSVYHQFDVHSLGGKTSSLIDAVSDGLAATVDRRPEKSASGVWVGSAGVVTPLHLDAWTGILFQLHGSKQVSMFGPDDRSNLYFLSPLAVGDRWSRLPGRSREADDETFPRFARATRHETQLDAGDALYIPPFWTHEIEALEPNVSMPFRFAVERSDYVHPLCLRALVELLHRRYQASAAA